MDSKGPNPQFDLEFEPLLDDIMVLGSALDEDAASAAAAAAGGAAPRRPSLDAHEDKLDRALEAHFGGMLSSVGKPAPQKLRAGLPLSGAASGKPGALPIEAFRSLFPGSLIIEESPTDELLGGPDPLVMDMLSETHAGFQEDMLPMVHAAQAAMRSPKVCHQDIMKHCSKSRSQLHCLGTHQQDISKACRDTVGKSVPFVCSSSVDKYCDTLHGGILPCLEQHMSSLEQNCQDAVVTTRQIITTANTHKVSLANKQTGAKTSVQPTAQAAAQAVHKELDRREAMKAQSRWHGAGHAFMLLTICTMAFVVYNGNAIFLPEWVNSRTGAGAMLTKLQVSQLKATAGSALGWSDRGRESQHLLSGVELPKPVESYKL